MEAVLRRIQFILLIHCCYGLNVCVSPKFIWWNHNPQCDGICKWGLREAIKFRWDYEDGGPHSGISILIRTGKDQSFLSPPREDKGRGSYLQAKKRVLTRSQICLHLNLGFPNLQNWENVIYLNRPVYILLHQSELRHLYFSIQSNILAYYGDCMFSSFFVLRWSPNHFHYWSWAGYILLLTLFLRLNLKPIMRIFPITIWEISLYHMPIM